MAQPLTWKNVAYGGSTAAASIAKLAESLGDAGEGFGGALQNMHDRKSDRLTGEGLTQIMQMDDFESSGADFARITAGMDPRYVDMEKLATAGQERQVSLQDMMNTDLDMEEKRFDIANQGRVLESELSYRAALASNAGRTAKTSQDKEDALAWVDQAYADNQKEDGSLDRIGFGQAARESKHNMEYINDGLLQYEASNPVALAKAAEAAEKKQYNDTFIKEQASKDVEMAGGGRPPIETFQSGWLDWSPKNFFDSDTQERALREYTADKIKFGTAAANSLWNKNYDKADGVVSWSKLAKERENLPLKKDSDIYKNKMKIDFG